MKSIFQLVTYFALTLYVAIVAPTPASASVTYAQKGKSILIDPDNVAPTDILQDALKALDQHSAAVTEKDRIAIVDFRIPSNKPRLFLVDLMTGAVERFIVAHGRGSDPENKGIVQRLSDAAGSLTSSAGAFVTAGLFQSGENGPAVFLEGLDPTNRHARSREIIVHSAPYVSPQWLKTHGKPGRSWGCFVVDQGLIQSLRAKLGTGRLLFAGPAGNAVAQSASFGGK